MFMDINAVAVADTPTIHHLFSDFPSSHPNPTKKRTKFLRIKTIKKPTAAAITATPPCTECGKTFPSRKALFGHMRCHPERQWRGINPPPTLRRSLDEDLEVAACLLMLANGPTAAASDTAACTIGQHTPDFSFSDRNPDQNVADVATAASNCGQFECSSCKKVFGSHQALGGHRASHKNVKGCYAINKNDVGDGEGEAGEMMMMMILNDDNSNNGHRCSICFRVFSSGQALGGHMRCHWEKEEEEPSKACEFDLNLAAPPPLVQEEEDDASFPCSTSSGPALELRLGF